MTVFRPLFPWYTYRNIRSVTKSRFAWQFIVVTCVTVWLAMASPSAHTWNLTLNQHLFAPSHIVQERIDRNRSALRVGALHSSAQQANLIVAQASTQTEHRESHAPAREVPLISLTHIKAGVGANVLYDVHIFSNGQVAYEGKQYVKELGRREFGIPSSDVLAALAAIENQSLPWSRTAREYRHIPRTFATLTLRRPEGNVLAEFVSNPEGNRSYARVAEIVERYAPTRHLRCPCFHENFDVCSPRMQGVDLCAEGDRLRRLFLAPDINGEPK